jgi:hypothetical protein
MEILKKLLLEQVHESAPQRWLFTNYSPCNHLNTAFPFVGGDTNKGKGIQYLCNNPNTIHRFTQIALSNHILW